MADPRFYDNRGPFALADVCAVIGSEVPPAADGAARVHDLASLPGAAAEHLAYCTGTKASLAALAATRAGFCIAGVNLDADAAPAGTVLLTMRDPVAAFAMIAAHFYRDHQNVAWAQQTPVDPTAELGDGVVLGPGVVIGPGAEIGDGTRIGAGTVIGRGVAIGRYCEIGSHATITHSYLGDRLLIEAGARVGQPGFGFVSSARGHVKIPQIGRAILQDDVEVGANVAIDRGALGDTVIGEGTKIDNLVHIGHNCRIGRHCLITAQVGVAGSAELGDFVVIGGQAGIADHTRVGDGARIGAKGGALSGEYPGGQDYAGFPLRPIKEWRREMATLASLARRRKRDGNG